MKRNKTLSTTFLAVVVVFASFLLGFSMSALFSPGIVDATFDEASVIPLERESDASNATGAYNIYADANPADWYYESVDYCIRMGLIAAYSDGNFYPDAKISRAMFALTLWNIEGYPFVDYDAPFIDVNDNQWYTPAIRWAASIGIIDGCGDGTFRPDNTLTREDLATIAWRYMKYKGVIPEDTKDTLEPYKDADEISAYAVLAMRWAHDAGMLLGTTDDSLSPLQGVTRAQFATFMSRYAPALDFQGSLMLLEHRLVAIKVMNGPYKATYKPGEEFDPAGMVVVGYFADGTTEIINDFTVTPTTDGDGNPIFVIESGDVDLVIPQSDIIDTVAGDNKQEETKPTTTLPIGIIGGYTPTPTPTPTNKTLKSVKVTTPPTKTAYVSGEAFDATGMVVTATYTDGSSEAVTGYTVTPTAMVEGVTSVTISYKGFGDTVAVTVGRALESITVTTPPTKTTYNHGDAFDAAGMVVTATYTDGSSEAVTGYTVTPNPLTYGTSNATITLGGKTCKTPVTVNRVLQSIAVTTAPTKTVYSHGENFDAVGMVVTATYTDGSSEAVTGYTVTPTAMTYGLTSVTVSYGGCTATLPVTVTHELQSIAVTTPPTKTTYNHGDAFDAAGMVVTATYVDGSSEAVTGYTVSPDPLTYGTTEVTVSFGSETATTPVTVNRVLQSIAATTPPTKVDYNHGDAFDATGMVVTATYTDGGTEAVTGYTVEPTEMTYGTTSVTISYGGKTTTVGVAVDHVLQSIAVTTAPDKTVYNHGETFDASGMVVTATYTDGSTSVVTGYAVTPDPLTYGTTAVTVSYGGYSDTTPVTVNRVLQSIAVTTEPTRTDYVIGDVFDPDGMVVTATYADGGTEAVTGYTTAPTGVLALGMTSVTVTYEEGGVTKNTAVSITVGRIPLDAVPSQSNTLTFTGSNQSPTWSGYNSTKMTISGTQSASDAGSYSVTFTPGADYKWPDGTETGKEVTWTIGRAPVAMPTASGTYTYNGSDQTLTITGFVEAKMTKGGTHTAKNAGDYTATISLNDVSNYQWSDGTIAAISFPWTINKKATTMSVTPTSVTLNATNPTATVTVTTDGDGAISASSNATSVATAVATGTTVTISNVSLTSGTATITVAQAAGTNYEAATSVTVSVTASFAPAWTKQSNGSLVTLGTFKANGTALARPTNPVNGGNIHHYSASETYLFGDTSNTAANNLQWIKLSDTLLVCDRCILDTISWQNIYKNYAAATYDANYNTITTQSSIIGVASGTTITIDGYTYRVRLLTGGATSPGTGSEWDLFNSLCAGDNSKMNWQNMYTWCSETSANGDSTYRPIRGCNSAAFWYNRPAADPGASCGFRPALELVSGG